MEMEKRRSKGSFLSLFDWNAKSRKKLLWNDPNLPVSKQGKENVVTLPESQLRRIKVDENGASPSNMASGDFSSNLSICSDEGCGSKAPGLVARLMGLDSLPASANTELSCTSLNGSSSHGVSHCNEVALPMDEFCPRDYMNMTHKLEMSSSDAMELRARKMENRPMKRFQTEMLPPKSAKPIPVTHNKLLSPIKSPGFLPPKNAAHLMEAAAKIIEASPQHYTRDRMPSVRSSSVPLRILDLKERLEAAQCAFTPEKLVGPSNANPANGILYERSSNSHKCTSAFKGSRDSEKNSSSHSATRRRSDSLALQAKPNVQNRDTLNSNGNRKYVKQKEQKEIKSNQLSRSQKPSSHRDVHQRTCTSRNSNVLGQNNQKQNCMTTTSKPISKIDSNKATARASSSESSIGTRKTTGRGAKNVNVQPKRSSLRATDNRKEFLPSKTESISQKKKFISRSSHEARSPDHAVNNFQSKSIKCNFTTDGRIHQDAFNMKEGKDVISFTFMSPLRKSMHDSPSSTEQAMEIRNSVGVNSPGHNDNSYHRNLSLSPPGLNMIDSDALSLLLEKKLQELTSRLNLPQCTLATEGTSTGLSSSLQDKVPSMVSITSKEQDKSFYPDQFSDKLDCMHNYHCSSGDPVLNLNQQIQTSEVREDPRCSSKDANDLGFQHPNAVTVLETSFASESYLDSEDSTYGSTVYSSMQDEEVSDYSQTHESVSLANEGKWSEQNSSTFTGGNMAVKQITRISDLGGCEVSSNMELEYIQDILENADFMSEEFVMGQADTVIMPNLFDLLENQGSSGTENYGDEYSKLERKVLFDCVSECLELRFTQAFVGRCKSWPRWVTSVQRKRWLAEELYKEMFGFRNMEEVMVDELVSKDMSTGCGKWLDFDIEAFEEGSEVEQDILASLINELVSDLLLG
ncbi:uncharacterized protein LOC130730913 isoform X2 [Lotus japonicus]|uniref:uncharacterized protein LOC130730913 isoform X2 n=1 Tax=Lotus japonicus TaxID=34305 RepID=UPI0025900599|nr:uncharacterized protein LOC130730913 isoform X2 [Lotus japonicus]